MLTEALNEQLAEQRVLLNSISWETYLGLLADLADQSSVRLTYDRGRLEIMSPLSEHEEINRTLAQLVEILSEELDKDIRRFGSVTLKREDIARGFEPDSCFYIENETKISGKKNIDLTIDPPPDLVIEVDITNPSIDKVSIYTQIGIPEFWRYNGKTITIFHLSDNSFLKKEQSLAFPLITADLLTSFLQQSLTMKSTAFSKLFREWIKNRQSIS